MNKKQTQKVIPILIVVLLLSAFIPQHFAQAGGCAPIPGLFDTTDCIKEILNVPFFVIAWLLSFVAGLLNDFIKASVVIIPAVRDSWGIMLNFVNMFFILILIVMAFGTIFAIEKYNWRNLLVPFLIVALLINFSFVIGTYVIDLGNGLSNVFLTTIAQSGNDLKTSLGQGLGLQKILVSKGDSITGKPLASIGNEVGSGIQYIITVGFFIIFGAIALLALISAFLFVLIRIPILWFLLIVSPVAWLGYALPNLKALTWSKWWSYFISWVFFLPVYLFFLMFGFIFIAAKNSTSQLASSGTLGGNALLVVNDIVFYVITLIFLVGGLWAAFKTGSVAGNGAGKLMGGIEKRVKQYAPGASYLRALRAGAKAGVAEKGKEISEKGVLGIGGAQAERLRAARVAEVFGARGAAEKARATEIDNEFKKLQQLNLDPPALLARMQKAKGVERIAALKLRAENGELNPTDLNEINSTMRELGGGKSVSGATMLQSLKKGKFHEMAVSTAEKERIFNGLTDLETQKAFGLDMAESREVMSVSLAEKLLGIYAGDTQEAKKKVEDALKNNIENMARDSSARSALLTNTTINPKIRKLAAQVMTDKKEVDSWKLRNSALETVGGIDAGTGEALTAEGRELAKNMKDGNAAIKEEADYRKANPAIGYVRDLNAAEHTALENQIVNGVKSGFIAGLSTEELKTPAIFNALYNGRASGTLTPDEFNKALGIKVIRGRLTFGKGKPDRKKREAINALVTATAPLAYP